MALIKTPISLLQEAMAKRAMALPEYETTTRSEMPGPKRFACTVKCSGMTATGYASTKKDAKHAAAKEALSKLGYSSEEPTKILTSSTNILPNTTTITVNDGINLAPTPAPRSVLINKIANANKMFVNYVGHLNEFVAAKRFIGYPAFDFDFDICTCQFISKCSLADVVVQGSGVNKKEAKQHAAQLMLEALSKKNLGPCDNTPFIRAPMADIDTQKVIERFKELSISIKDTAINTKNISSLPAVKFHGINNNESQTIEELEAILKEKNISYSIRIIKKPQTYLAIITVRGTKLTHLGCGGTTEAATWDALKQAIFVAKIGFSDTFAP